MIKYVFNQLLYWIFGTIRPYMLLYQHKTNGMPMWELRFKQGWGKKGMALQMDAITIIMLAEVMLNKLEKEPAALKNTSTGLVEFTVQGVQLPLPADMYFYILRELGKHVKSAYTFLEMYENGRQSQLQAFKDIGAPEDKVKEFEEKHPSPIQALLKELAAIKGVKVPDSFTKPPEEKRVLH